MVCADTDSRSARFLAYTKGVEPPSFADIANPSALRRTAHESGEDLALVAGYLHYRRAIDGLVEGARLARLAEAVGTARFDNICDSDVAGFDLVSADTALPDIMALRAAGATVLARADGCASACRLAERAADIVMATERTAS